MEWWENTLHFEVSQLIFDNETDEDMSKNMILFFYFSLPKLSNKWDKKWLISWFVGSFMA